MMGHIFVSLEDRVINLGLASVHKGHALLHEKFATAKLSDLPELEAQRRKLDELGRYFQNRRDNSNAKKVWGV